MKKVIVILGQTASGKSDLAVRVARKFGGEIISADSRQVYRGLDIGSNKITRKEMRGVPHYMLDIANPRRRFSVSQFKKLAEEKIKDIIARGKTPIICGGTGFYIDALTQGLVLPEVQPNIKLRKTLEKKSVLELFKILKKLDPKRAQNIDPHNKVRLVRAIEIAQALGKVPKLKTTRPSYKFIKIGLYLPLPILESKLRKRTVRMFRQGLLREVARIKKLGLSDRRMKELGFEYYHPTPESVNLGNIKYAKRQMTWFKRDKEIKWFTAQEDGAIFSFLENAIPPAKLKR